MSSGAQFEVLKTAPPGPVRDRLYAQARWLQEHLDPGIVRLKNIVLGGYSMELLQKPDGLYTHPSQQADLIIAILERAVWNRPSPVMTWPNFEAYLERLDIEMAYPVLKSWKDGMNAETPTCDTHGDPTLENLMFRGKTPVLIDPLPDPVLTGKIPPIRAVDLGKILQSALGYERVKYDGQPWSWNSNLAYIVRETCRDADEWELSCFFAAVHVARFVPYQSPELQNAWRKWYPNIVELLRD